MPVHLRGPCIPGAAVTSALPPPPPPGVASLLPELSFLQGRARPELPGSLRQICGEPGLCKEGDVENSLCLIKVLWGGEPCCQLCLRSLKIRETV